MKQFGNQQNIHFIDNPHISKHNQFYETNTSTHYMYNTETKALRNKHRRSNGYLKVKFTTTSNQSISYCLGNINCLNDQDRSCVRSLLDYYLENLPVICGTNRALSSVTGIIRHVSRGEIRSHAVKSRLSENT